MITLWSVSAILLTITYSQSADLLDCSRKYTVQGGDFCNSISVAQNISTHQLAKLNPAIDATCSNLVPGQVLCLGSSGEDCGTTYVISVGDTCDTIANKLGISKSVLTSNNPQINDRCTNIYTGQVLCAAQGLVQDTSAQQSLTPYPSPVPAAAPSSITDDGDDGLPYCDEL